MEDYQVELEEYKQKRVPRDKIPEELGLRLQRDYGGKIDVQFPNLGNDNNWLLTSQGWVGHIQLSKEISIRMLPRVSLDNIFGMLEYAYDLKSFELRSEIDQCGSIRELFDRLVKILSKRVLLRIKRGLYGDYLPYTESLPYVRGRLDTNELLRKPWSTKPVCSYHDHTRDVEENQIISWTLKRVIISGVGTRETLNLAQKAYRSLKQVTTEIPFNANACISRLYNRLNDDYKPMHLLCRFFLENSGPSLENGDRQMIAFTVNMPRLFELFVARWLSENIEDPFLVKAQEKVEISSGSLHFSIDLVLYDRYSGKALAVMDTKYKVSEDPSINDLYQTTAYAVSKGCEKAFLIYPSDSTHIDARVNRIRIRSLSFPLHGDLQSNGQKFLQQLLSML